MPERALVVAAHADDIEFGVSGTAARWAEAGSEVTYLIVTDNGAGSNEPGADLEALRRTRRDEAVASAQAVGAREVRFLSGYKDGHLEPTMALRKELTQHIRDIRPQVVVCFDPETIIAPGRDYINHPDHVAVAMATLYAVFPSAGSRPIFMDLLDAGYEPHEVERLYLTLTKEPTLHVDISSTMEKKQNALRCHASQLNEEAVQMVTRWNAEAGAEAGFDYAEVFRVLNFKREETNGAGNAD